jgi:hypothetical protein
VAPLRGPWEGRGSLLFEFSPHVVDVVSVLGGFPYCVLEALKLGEVKIGGMIGDRLPIAVADPSLNVLHGDDVAGVKVNLKVGLKVVIHTIVGDQDAIDGDVGGGGGVCHGWPLLFWHHCHVQCIGILGGCQ